MSDDKAQAALRASDEQQRKQRMYSVEVVDRKKVGSYYLGAKPIERIEIKNFRLIEDLVLDFPPPHSEREPWLVLLGENGVGKSSVLQGRALALMGQTHANRLQLDASHFVRRQATDSEGYVRVHLTNVGPAAVGILNLFDPTAPLSDTEALLLEVNDQRFLEFTQTLVPLLMLPKDAQFSRDRGVIEVEYRGVRRPARSE